MSGPRAKLARSPRALFLLSMVTGCTLDDVDFTGKSCAADGYCPAGFVCSAGTCQREGAAADCQAAFAVEGFQRLWETPKSIRWTWTPLGPADSFVAYKLVLGEDLSELDAARSAALAGTEPVGGGRVYTSNDNPELGQYELRLSSDVDVIRASTTGDLEPGTEYRAQLLAFDTNGCAFVTPAALASTQELSTLSFSLFDDEPHPEGEPRPQGVASIESDPSEAFEGAACVRWPGWPDDLSVPDGTYENVGIIGFETVPEQNYPLLDFHVAYLEAAIRIDGPALAAWGEARLILGPPGGGCASIETATIKPYVFRPGGEYQVVELPLDQFRFGATPIQPADLSDRSICEVSFGRAWAIGEPVRVDAIRLRW